MISSITSKNKDVISLTPVQNMSFVELSRLMLQVITNVTHSNFKTPCKGKHKRLDDANPISDLNDNRITWMTEFVTWFI